MSPTPHLPKSFFDDKAAIINPSIFLHGFLEQLARDGPKLTQRLFLIATHDDVKPSLQLQAIKMIADMAQMPGMMKALLDHASKTEEATQNEEETHEHLRAVLDGLDRQG